MRPFFKDEGFNFQTEAVLGAAYRRAADIGEVLSTVERIRNGHAQSWVDEWTATADRLGAGAPAHDAAGGGGAGGPPRPRPTPRRDGCGRPPGSSCGCRPTTRRPGLRRTEPVTARCLPAGGNS